METIQVVLDKELLHATNKVARKMKANRSALVREALREHLKRLEIRAKEDHEREAYMKHPQDRNEARIWESVAAWPDE
jgi:metal-responsive CopG/Arc/MetJ family transcriptional regulator